MYKLLLSDVHASDKIAAERNNFHSDVFCMKQQSEKACNEEQQELTGMFVAIATDALDVKHITDTMAKPATCTWNNHDRHSFNAENKEIIIYTSTNEGRRKTGSQRENS